MTSVETKILLEKWMTLTTEERRLVLSMIERIKELPHTVTPLTKKPQTEIAA